jgi:hypothetical protein
LDGFVLLHQDLLDDAGHRRRNFGVDLVGRNFYQWFVDGYGVANFLKPTGDSAFCNAFTKRWKYY